MMHAVVWVTRRVMLLDNLAAGVNPVSLDNLPVKQKPKLVVLWLQAVFSVPNLVDTMLTILLLIFIKGSYLYKPR